MTNDVARRRRTGSMTSPDARTDFETRIYQRLTDTVGADEGTRCPHRPI